MTGGAVGVIADVLRAHTERQLMNYDTGREECGCGRQGDATHAEHVAGEVVAAQQDEIARLHALIERGLAYGDQFRTVVAAAARAEFRRAAGMKPPRSPEETQP